MRIKNKLHCDYCGKFIMELSKEQMNEILKLKQEGTRLSYVAKCPACIKNSEKKENKEERKLLLKWHKDRSKLKYVDKHLRVTEKGVRAIGNAIETYRKHENFREDYAKFLEDLRMEMVFILCEEYLI